MARQTMRTGRHGNLNLVMDKQSGLLRPDLNPGKTRIYGFNNFGRTIGMNPVDRSTEGNRFTYAAHQRGMSGGGGGGGRNYQAENEAEKKAGYKAIERGENRMAGDANMARTEKYISDILDRERSKLDPLSAAQKAAEIEKSEGMFNSLYDRQMGNLGRVAGASGIGATGVKGKSVLASGKEQYGKQRAKALADARAGITAGTIRSANQVAQSAANLGLQTASAKSRAAEPFTMAESKARFGSSFPNV